MFCSCFCLPPKSSDKIFEIVMFRISVSLDVKIKKYAIYCLIFNFCSSNLASAICRGIYWSLCNAANLEASQPVPLKYLSHSVAGSIHLSNEESGIASERCCFGFWMPPAESWLCLTSFWCWACLQRRHRQTCHWNKFRLRGVELHTIFLTGLS